MMSSSLVRADCFAFAGSPDVFCCFRIFITSLVSWRMAAGLE
jgi:hypothetical protein